MENGWIKLHRKINENAIYANPYLLKLWVHCLLKATHKGREQLIGNQLVKLEPGQFVTGREALATEFNKGAKSSDVVSALSLWRWLNNFEKWGMLNIKKTTKFSVVTITNWYEHQQDEQQVNNKRTTDEQQVNTNKNVKNDKNEKKKDIDRKQAYDTDSDSYKLASFMFQVIRTNNPNHKEPNLQAWADDFRKLLEIDQRDRKEVAKLVQWVQRDEFEMVNVLSPTKLRKRYDNLYMKMTKDKNSGQIHHVHTAKPKEYVPDFNAGED